MSFQADQLIAIVKFNRVLLSEYNVEYGLSKHADYKTLKNIVHELQNLPTTEVLSVCHDKFFSKVGQEVERVMAFYRDREGDLMQRLQRLQLSTVSDVVGHESDIIELYIQLHMLNSFRNLNFFGLRKLLEKFTKRCALKSITLQALCDKTYNDLMDSQIYHLDIADAMEFLAKVLMKITPKMNYEMACQQLELAMQRDYRCRPRILSNTMAAFFRPNKIPRREMKYHLRIVSGNTNPRLAHDVETLLGRKQSTRSKVKTFANGEVDVSVQGNVLGDDIFVIQSTVWTKRVSCSQAIVELMLLCNALRLEGVGRLTAVVPYMGYATSPHGTAVAQMLVRSGVQHIITVDLAVDQVEGYFHHIPVENITARKELVKYTYSSLTIEGTSLSDVIVVSCDSHSVSRARAFADALSKVGNAAIGLVTAFIPPPPQESLLVGNVQGKHCVIVDNAIDEGTLVAAVTQLLLANGAVAVKVVATHGIFSANSVNLLSSCGIQEIIVTDSLPYDFLLNRPEMANRTRIIPIAPLLAEAIERVHNESTLSSIFK